MIASWPSLSATAKPTFFHYFLQMLEEHGRLRRIYTQNIDGLEEKVGFDLQTTSLSSRCIQLHGSVFRLRCMLCSTKFPLEHHFKSLQTRKILSCTSCEKQDKGRTDAGKRRQGVGCLRPDIVLYDEEVQEGELIADVVAQDALAISTGHILIVVGTSLHISGANDIIKTLGKKSGKGWQRHIHRPQ